MQCVTELAHPESRKKGIELVSRAAHYLTDHRARGACEERIDPKKHEKDKFSKLIADYLNENYQKRAFNQLIIIAPPSFWGLLGKHLPKSVFESISEVIQKDYTIANEAEIREILK